MVLVHHAPGHRALPSSLVLLWVILATFWPLITGNGQLDNNATVVCTGVPYTIARRRALTVNITENHGTPVAVTKLSCALPPILGNPVYSLANDIVNCDVLCPGPFRCNHTIVCFRIDRDSGQLEANGIDFEGSLGYMPVINVSVSCAPTLCVDNATLQYDITLNISPKWEYSYLIVSFSCGYSYSLAFSKTVLKGKHVKIIACRWCPANDTVFRGRDLPYRITGITGPAGEYLRTSDDGQQIMITKNLATLPPTTTALGGKFKVWSMEYSVTLSVYNYKQFQPSWTTPPSSPIILDEVDSILYSLIAHLTCFSNESFHAPKVVNTSVQGTCQEGAFSDYLAIVSDYSSSSNSTYSASNRHVRVYVKKVPSKRLTTLNCRLRCSPSKGLSVSPYSKHKQENPPYDLRLDINHHGLQFTKSTFNGLIPENQPPGTAIHWQGIDASIECIGTRYCKHPSWKISLNNSATLPFIYNSSSGLIESTTMLSKRSTSYSLLIHLSPIQGTSDTATIFVRVVDADDDPIEFSGSSYINVDFATPVGTNITGRVLSDTDTDLSQPSCTLTSPNRYFSVSSSCQIVVKTSLLYLPFANHSLIIQAVDTDVFGPKRTANATVTIMVNYTGQGCQNLELSLLSPGSLVNSTYPSNIAVKCALGFRTNDLQESRAICLTSGNWTMINSCQEALCREPPPVLGGIWQTKTTVFQGFAAYTCQSGFKSHASPVIQCSDNGNTSMPLQWTGSTPKCHDVNECILQPGVCYNATCHNIFGSYGCQCTTGFKLSSDGRSCQNINECHRYPSPCSFHADCVDTDGSFQCTCKQGYNGTGYSCHDIDECSTQSCGRFDCTNTVGSYICKCKDGLKSTTSSPLCTEDINECSTNPCESRNCTNTFGGFKCDCPPGYYTQRPVYSFSRNDYSSVGMWLFDRGRDQKCKNVDECAEQACGGMHTCSDTIGSYTCSCAQGYRNPSSSKSVCENVNECNQQVCTSIMGSQCRDTNGSYLCECSVGYQLPTLHPTGTSGSTSASTGACVDIDECKSSGVNSSCKPHTCLNTNGSYMCLCQSGYSTSKTSSDTLCLDNNECDLGLHNCSDTFECVNEPGSYGCSCPTGLNVSSSANECIADVDECTGQPDLCKPHSCMNSHGSYQCLCSTGYANVSSTQCQEIDECLTMQHDCHSSATCRNTLASYQCQCSHGFAAAAATNSSAMRVCVDIPECANTSICQRNEECIEQAGSYLCRCQQGFYRRTAVATSAVASASACLDRDECASQTHECSKNALCSNTAGSYECSCPFGLTGKATNDTCIDIDECRDGLHFCANNTICHNTFATHNCACKAGFSGNALVLGCKDIDECLPDPASSSPCSQSSTCQNTDGSYNCVCLLGYAKPINSTICQDVNECVQTRNICGDNSVCYNSPGSYQCHCLSGYSNSSSSSSKQQQQQNCTDVDECLSSQPLCRQFSVCQNVAGSYRCPCSTNAYYNNLTKQCEQDECKAVSNDCGPNTKCTKSPGTYECNCLSGFTGFPKTRCDDINECLIAAASTCPENSKCSNSEGSFECVCNYGYSKPKIGGNTCHDQDECAAEIHNCHSNAECINTIGGYRCSCIILQGYVGDGFSCTLQLHPTSASSTSSSTSASTSASSSASSSSTSTASFNITPSTSTAGAPGFGPKSSFSTNTGVVIVITVAVCFILFASYQLHRRHHKATAPLNVKEVLENYKRRIHGEAAVEVSHSGRAESAWAQATHSYVDTPAHETELDRRAHRGASIASRSSQVTALENPYSDAYALSDHLHAGSMQGKEYFVLDELNSWQADKKCAELTALEEWEPEEKDRMAALLQTSSSSSRAAVQHENVYSLVIPGGLDTRTTHHAQAPVDIHYTLSPVDSLESIGYGITAAETSFFSTYAGLSRSRQYDSSNLRRISTDTTGTNLSMSPPGNSRRWRKNSGSDRESFSAVAIDQGLSEADMFSITYEDCNTEELQYSRMNTGGKKRQRKVSSQTDPTTAISCDSMASASDPDSSHQLLYAKFKDTSKASDKYALSKQYASFPADMVAGNGSLAAEYSHPHFDRPTEQTKNKASGKRSAGKAYTFFTTGPAGKSDMTGEHSHIDFNLPPASNGSRSGNVLSRSQSVRQAHTPWNPHCDNQHHSSINQR
eukprot:scpid6927/ scgid17744/ Fibrillin-1